MELALSSAKNIKNDPFEQALALARLVPYLTDQAESESTLLAALSCAFALPKEGRPRPCPTLLLFLLLSLS